MPGLLHRLTYLVTLGDPERFVWPPPQPPGVPVPGGLSGALPSYAWPKATASRRTGCCDALCDRTLLPTRGSHRATDLRQHNLNGPSRHRRRVGSAPRWWRSLRRDGRAAVRGQAAAGGSVIRTSVPESADETRGARPSTPRVAGTGFRLRRQPVATPTASTRSTLLSRICGRRAWHTYCCVAGEEAGRPMRSSLPRAL